MPVHVFAGPAEGEKHGAEVAWGVGELFQENIKSYREKVFSAHIL